MTNKKRQFTSSEIQDIIKSFEQKETLASIAIRYGYAAGSARIIRDLLVVAGVATRTYRLREITIKNGKKLCRICNEWKDLELFYKRKWKNKPSTEYSYCKSCNKIANPQAYFWFIKKEYGITKEEYLSLLEEQNFCCAICKYKPNFSGAPKKKERLVIDHNHLTNTIRGLLCDNCNKAIGQFKENIDNIRAAVKYMETNDR